VFYYLDFRDFLPACQSALASLKLYGAGSLKLKRGEQAGKLEFRN
jgi:hypothetical protein